MLNQTRTKSTALYRMVTREHVCPFGLKSLDLLQCQGFEVEDHKLRTRAETDAFMAREGVDTTPQAFIDGNRIGGYDDLRRYFHEPIADPNSTSYQPSSRSSRQCSRWFWQRLGPRVELW